MFIEMSKWIKSYLFQTQMIGEDIDVISCTDYFWIKQSIHNKENQRKLLYPKTFVAILRHLPATLLHMPQEPNQINKFERGLFKWGRHYFVRLFKQLHITSYEYVMIYMRYSKVNEYESTYKEEKWGVNSKRGKGSA